MVAPSLTALICAFAYGDRAISASRSDVMIGIALGVIALFLGVGLAVNVGFPR